MPRFPLQWPVRLAAIDLDGTLLNSTHQLGEENRRAVQGLIEAGVEVVLASGRHHDAIRPFALQLPGLRWLVCVQGGEVSTVARDVVLERHFLTAEQVSHIAAVLRRPQVTALFYATEGILTTASPNEDIAFYEHLSGNLVKRVDAAELADRNIFKVVTAASEAAIDTLISQDDVQAVPLQRVRTHRRFFEFMPQGVTKASGLETLAAHLGIPAREAAAFGDGDNDVPMFKWAGVSVAMAHGWPHAKEEARHIAPEGPADSALARAIACLI